MEKLHEHHNLTVDPGQRPLRIDVYLSKRLDNITRSQIQRAAKDNCIIVNDMPVKQNYKVKPGDVIRILLPKPKTEIKIIPEDIPLNIIYEDEHLLIINKEPGMVVHPAYGHYSGTLVNALAFHLKDNPYFKNNDTRPGLVHRIDKDTSGLLVVAKNDFAKNFLSDQFAAHTTKRRYIALVWGDLKNDAGTITGHIGRHPKNRKIMFVFPEGNLGKHAITHFKVLKRYNFVTLIECRLETGRTHQIRAHFKHINHPLFNDADYGGDKILWGIHSNKYKQFIQNCFEIMPRHALHAQSLGFIHPATKKEMFFESPLPQDFQLLLEKWDNYYKIFK